MLNECVSIRSLYLFLVLYLFLSLHEAPASEPLRLRLLSLWLRISSRLWIYCVDRLAQELKCRDDIPFLLGGKK
jgi:hypothetical protein